ncbi:O-antigen ligase family protein [Clostridium akagii]|uniref:O-antigen ligase family protein n=1 Tax=Clostridium akagii TaxID=91623 RepID=UPI00047C8711|nr:O-antigen ligase family protein [Clostridium akagii]
MRIKNKLIYYILCAYVILIPIIPNGLKLNIIPKIHEIPPFGISLLALLILIFFISAVKNWRGFIGNLKDFSTDFLGISMLALLGIMVISIFYASYRMIAITESARFLSYVLLYIIIKYNMDNNQVKGIINSYLFTFTVINIYGIFQKITGFALLSGYAVPGTNILRTNATFDNPNTFAAFLLIGAFPVLMMIVKGKNIISKSIFTIIFVMTLCNISFTGSRNSYLALAVGAVILAVIYSWYFLIGLGGIVGIAFAIPMVNTRLFQIGKGSIDAGRIHIWKTALKMIQEHPLLGVGNGNFTELYDTYVAKYKYLRYLNYSHYPSHNAYLKIESELGVVGGISFIAIILGAIIKVKSVIKNIEDKDLKLFYIGFFASMIGFFFMNLLESLFTVPEVVAYFWIFLACADALLYRERTNTY